MSILINDVLFNVPLFGFYLRRAGHVPVSVVSSNGGIALERARQLLLAGRTVAIFPEGDISPLEGGFLKPHSGVARLSLSTGAPVIPIGIHLQRERIRLLTTQVSGKPEVGAWYFRGRYAITVGKPLYFTGGTEDRAHVRSVAESVMQHIIRLAQESAQRMMGTQSARSAR